MDGSILVVEDEISARDLLATNLQHAGYRVSCADGVPDAELMLRQTRPDLVLIDWALPGIPGLSFARKLRRDQRTRDVSLVLISERVEEHDKVAALRELLARIKAVLRRRTPQLADDVVAVGGLQLDPAARRVSAGDREIDLWTTEFRLLHFLMTRPGRVLSRARLLDEVWGYDALVEERTVDVHVRRLRQALEPTGHNALIETVRGLGYRFQCAAGAQ
jgi:two-component system phosphate regulon response regulator PhoB